MAMTLSACAGCLLGLAAGDALGRGVDKMNYDEIRRDFGPDGILGYDLRNGVASVSSHTQLAAYACNGLLLAATRGKSRNGSVPYTGYLAHALREWAQYQQPHPSGSRAACWVSHIPCMREKYCLDSHTLQTLYSGELGSLNAPANSSDTPGNLTAAVAVGLFFDAARLHPSALGVLGAQSVALTHGDPVTFLCGAVVAYTIAGVVQDRETPLWQQFLLASQAVSDQFSHRFPIAEQLRLTIGEMVTYAQQQNRNHAREMHSLSCSNALQVLRGVIYACVAGGGDFEQALTIAVNHSGRSAAVGALTGAILGAWLGEEMLPEFYTESLPAASCLRELAQDLCQAGARAGKARLFDDDWDCKYVQGMPVEVS